jgi:hypothetical protein
MQEQTNATPTLTNKELFNKLVPIFTEILTLEEDAKALKEDADDSELNYSAVAALAKAKARSKLQQLEEKAQATLDLIEELEG